MIQAVSGSALHMDFRSLIDSKNFAEKYYKHKRGCLLIHHIIKNYLCQGSFEGNRYRERSAYKLSTGEMLFGTSDGFIMFDPDSIKDDPVPPQVVISNVSLFNRPGEKLEFDGFISEMKTTFGLIMWDFNTKIR